MTAEPLDRVRESLLAMDGVTERQSHGEPSWFYRDKRQIATWAGYHHDDRLAMWCAAPPGVQETLVASEPEHYFRPPYVGHRGWVGVFFDVEPDWETVGRLLADAYALTASKR